VNTDTREALAALDRFESRLRNYMMGNETIEVLDNARDNLIAALATRPAQPREWDEFGRTNSGDETGGTVQRFGFDLTGSKPDIIPATNGAFVYYDDYLALHRKLAAQPSAQGEAVAWRPIKTAPRNGTSLLLRFGIDGVSQGKYVPGIPHPWKFIDTNDGITWLVNHAIDGPGGPSHWMHLPSADLSPDFHAAPAAPAQAVPLTDEQCDAAIREIGLDYLADGAPLNRTVLRQLCKRAHGIAPKAAQENAND